MRCLYCTLDFIYFIFFCIVYRVLKKKTKKKKREGRKTTGTKEAVWAVQVFQSVEVVSLGFTVKLCFQTE